MFVINEDKSIYITRGDVAFFSIEAKTDTGEKYKFMPGDVVRFKVCERKACENVVLSKDFGIETEAEEVSIYLEEKDTKFGEVISKPVEYWYEVELNPYTDPQTILGYDEDGAKIFRLFPEGNEKEDEDPITPEDIPVVDEELDLTSTRPVQNQAIARAFLKINEDLEAKMEVVDAEVGKHIEAIEEAAKDLTNARGNKIVNVADPTEDTDAVNLNHLKKRYGVKKIIKLATPAEFFPGPSFAGDFELVNTSTEDFVLMATPFSDSQNYATRVFIRNGKWLVNITDRTTGEPYVLPADKYDLSMTVYYMFGNE